jgi:hypothetical protein
LGDLKAPTPAGVPVITAVPAGIVVPDQKCQHLSHGRVVGPVVTLRHVTQDFRRAEDLVG